MLRVLSVRRAPGKLRYLAVLSVWINDIAAELAARRLREAG
jgi:hypothetical protein